MAITRITALGCLLSLVLTLPLQAQTPSQTKDAPKKKPPVITFTTEPTPPMAGAVELRVVVKEAKGEAISDANVSVGLVMPSMAEMKKDVTLPAAGGGSYRAIAQLEMAGRWDITITVVREGQRPVTKRQLLIVQ